MEFDSFFPTRKKERGKPHDLISKMHQELRKEVAWKESCAIDDKANHVTKFSISAILHNIWGVPHRVRSSGLAFLQRAE